MHDTRFTIQNSGSRRRSQADPVANDRLSSRKLLRQEVRDIFPVCFRSGQDGGKEAADRRHGDADQHQYQLAPVGLQVGKNPLKQFFGDFRGILFFFFGKELGSSPASGSWNGNPLLLSVFLIILPGQWISKYARRKGFDIPEHSHVS